MNMEHTLEASRPVESFGGILDFFNFLSPDWSKVNREEVKAAVAKLIDAMKPATTWPGNFDDLMWDQLKGVVNTYIDKIGVKDTGPVTVGDVEYKASDVTAYLGGFKNVHPEVHKKLREKPRMLNLVKTRFTEAEQAKLVGNPFLIGLLSIFGPLIVEWIKKWLSK